MKQRSLSERGQALILVALGAIALFAIAGLAIDGSHMYSDRRHAQNAADTAALAGAYAKATGASNWDMQAKNRAGDNDYTGDLVHSVVEVYTCDDTHARCGIYASGSDP